MYARVCVCVCVRARVCVRERERERKRKRGARRGRRKRIKTTDYLREGDKRFSYSFDSLLSLFHRFFVFSLLHTSPTAVFFLVPFFFFFKASRHGGEKALHPRSHEHPFYFSSTTAIPLPVVGRQTDRQTDREKEREGERKIESQRGEEKAQAEGNF